MMHTKKKSMYWARDYSFGNAVNVNQRIISGFKCGRAYLLGLLLSTLLIGGSNMLLIQGVQAQESSAELIALHPLQLESGVSFIDLEFQDAVPPLRHFILENPPRIIVDLANASNNTGQRLMQIEEGALESIAIGSDDARLRLVLNLSDTVEFSTDELTNGYRLSFGVGTNPVSPERAMASNVNENSTASMPAQKTAVKLPSALKNIDFHRTSDGKGQVIVNLNDPDVVVDFKVQSGELIADFIGASIENKFERRLDVVDFATPVNTIDIFRHENNTRVIVSPNAQFKHTVTQTADRYLIEVAPLTKPEKTALKEDEAAYVGEVLSLNFQSIPVRAALQVIADFTGFNIITSDSVTGELSLRLNDVPWDQALDLILQTKDLGMRQKGNVIRVAPSEELMAQERAEFEAKRDVIEIEPLVTELIRINYAKAEDIRQILRSVKAVDTGFEQTPFGSVSITEVKTEENTLLSARGSVTVDARTNTLLIQDTPSHIREIRALVEKLDIPVRQIQIETRIVEATDDFSRSLGARLGFTRITAGARFPGTSGDDTIGTVFGSGSIDSNSSVRDDNVILYPDSLSVNLPADSLGGLDAASYAYQIAKIGPGYLNLLDLEISALQAEGQGKIIANPKITTTDKHEAHIEQGQERVFASSSLIAGGTITKKAVLGLTVTPQITPDDQIILDVRVTNDSFSGDNTLNTKQIETQTLLSNGETIVIGGIYQQDQGESVVKTPILGDIPLLGHLFKKRTRRDNRTELLVFLTPRIIKPGF